MYWTRVYNEAMTTNHTHWTAHTNRDGQACAKCSTCGSNAHPDLVGTDEDCARCIMNAAPQMEPLVLPRIDVADVIRFAR